MTTAAPIELGAIAEEGVVGREGVSRLVSLVATERVKITIALHALVADELVELEACVVVGLARARAAGTAVDTRVDDDVVRAAYLMVALVVLAAAENQEIGRVVVCGRFCAW